MTAKDAVVIADVADLSETYEELKKHTDNVMKINFDVSDEADARAAVTSALRQFSIVKFTFKCLPEVLSMDEFRGYAGGERFQTILTDPAEP